MKNYKVTDLKFFKETFRMYENTKINKIIQKEETSNYNNILDKFSRKYLYELGYKKAFTVLTTDNYQNKCSAYDLNLFYDKKYCNMFPKSNCLGQPRDQNFSKKTKKIGDISFEETNNLNEDVKDLKRLSPDFITEESLKDNLNDRVEILRLENCNWLSKDLISKIGRMDPNMKELCLRNLTIDNSILLNILKYVSK
jgi:hypothetical protein